MNLKDNSDAKGRKLATIDRHQFANLWKEWEQSECRFYDAIAGLVEELSNQITASHSGHAKYALLDLMFSEEEQHKMFVEWEAEEKAH